MTKEWRDALRKHYEQVLVGLEQLVDIGYEINEFRITTEIDGYTIVTSFWNRFLGTRPVKDITTHLEE